MSNLLRELRIKADCGEQFGIAFKEKLKRAFWRVSGRFWKFFKET